MWGEPNTEHATEAGTRSERNITRVDDAEDLVDNERQTARLSEKICIKTA